MRRPITSSHPIAALIDFIVTGTHAVGKSGNRPSY